MKETIIVNQPFGIGDILFISPIIKKLDYDVIWPVNDQYIWIKDYLQLPNTQFITMKQYLSEPIYSLVDKIDFLNAENILRSMGNRFDCMSAKYHYASEEVSNWKTLSWNRNTKKENELYSLLNIKDDEEYTLVNCNFASPELKYRIDITTNDNHRVIQMDYIDGFTLLDWGKVIENAKSFHTVSTATFYMVEFLNCKETELHLYPRFGIDVNLNPIRPIISERWLCHE
jgi:hypothetical protein